MQKELRKSLKEVYKNTPTVSVYSNQGLVVRGIGYYRRVADEEAAIRISLQRYNNAGQLTSSVDPRLSVAYLKNPTAVIPNQQQQNTLSGNVLQSQNVDAGTRVFFSDVRGQALWGWDSRGTINEFEYDKLHRITAVYEKTRGKAQFCSERLSYGIAGDSLIGNNGVGRLSEHYDTAGRRVIPEYSLLGQVRTEVQFFIKAGEVGHWIEDAVENEKHLETTGYTSAWTYTALGEVIGQRDAQGNERGTVYDVAGQVSETWLQLKESEKKTLSERRVYNASGQLQEERLGNGIGMNYRYEAKTQRLSEKEAKRLSDNTLLQSLHYTYDPVGNILSITDKAEAETIDFYKNNKAEAISRYTYDSFYQLIVADGIENEQAGQQGKKNTIVFGNKDASRVVNYQRSYDYDAGGNLLEIGQLGANPAMKLTIDTQSNRGIEQRESGPSLQESFDANGNLLYINTGQPLSWDNRNQLQESVQVEREGISDKEIYLYDGQGSRIQKTRTYLAESQIHTERVRYLPGIELREHWQTDLQGENQQNKERLFLIQAQAGDAPVKALHWELGQPSEIENDGMYYTLTDQIGSSQIELDEIGELINYEAYYPYGGTAIWTTKNQVVSNYKYRRYSGKERDHSGLYYYGYRYYLPWLGRWLNPDPSGISQGLNLFEMVGNNPIAFIDEGGRKPTPSFKQLYPETETDPRTGEIYRPIKEVFNFTTTPNRRSVDVKSFEISSKLGKGFYLFQGPTKAKRLLVSAHGGFYANDKLKDIVLSSGMPTVTVLGPHAQILSSDAYYQVDKSYAKISYEGITLSSEEAQRDFEQSSYVPITGTGIKRTVHNYVLQKFETEASGDISYQTHLFEYAAYYVSKSHKQARDFKESFDVLTLRKGTEATLQEILTIGQKRGYTEIVCDFCRSLEPREAGTKRYFPEKTKLLENAEFKTWSNSMPKSPSIWTRISNWFRSKWSKISGWFKS